MESVNVFVSKNQWKKTDQLKKLAKEADIVQLLKKRKFSHHEDHPYSWYIPNAGFEDPGYYRTELPLLLLG